MKALRESARILLSATMSILLTLCFISNFDAYIEGFEQFVKFDYMRIYGYSNKEINNIDDIIRRPKLIENAQKAEESKSINIDVDAIELDEDKVNIEEYTYEALSNTSYSASNPQITEPEFIKYTLKSGDSWYKLSTKYYGSGEYSKVLELYNNIENFWPGVEIKIPNIDDSNFKTFVTKISEDSKQKALKYQESMKGKTIKAGKNSKVDYGTRYNPAVDITIPTSDNMRNGVKLDTSNLIFYGNCFVTGYTPTCIDCCESPEGITATGVYAIPGYTVAMSDAVPYGTTIYIEWSDGTTGAYVKEDTGALKDTTVDIACPYDEACGLVTEKKCKVWIVPN